MSRETGLVLEADRGSGPVGISTAAFLSPQEHQAREATREGLAELDRMAEAMGRLSRRQKDAVRVLPRDGGRGVNPRKVRHLDAPDALRVPVSRWQRRQRQKDLVETQQRWTSAQTRTVRELLAGNDALWNRLNDALSEHVGDIDELSLRDRARVRQLDRAIRQYEECNDRKHVVYTGIKLPPGLGFQQLKPGTQVVFDRFTMTRHNLHEVSDLVGDDVCVVEIATHRGLYCAGPGETHTSHLLPRAMRYEVAETFESIAVSPDGTRTNRKVIRLTPIEQEKP